MRIPSAPRPPVHLPSIHYKVTIVDPEREMFTVAAELHNIAADTLIFQFPMWTPGAYGVVDYGASVHDLTAKTPDGSSLRVTVDSGGTYRIHGVIPGTRISYEVSDIESSPSMPWFALSEIEPEFAFANGAALFGYPTGYVTVPYTVTYSLPSHWRISSGLKPITSTTDEFVARDYDELVDAPLLAGVFERIEVEIKGKPHEIAVLAPMRLPPKQTAALRRKTEQIVNLISDFFGEMPYDHYVFQHILLGEAIDSRFGALEHRNSSTYLMPYYGSVTADILAPMIAHEYWHVWSPKRFHVREFGPFDYRNVPHVGSLWLAEGVTEYFSRTIMVRNGLESPLEFLQLMERDIGLYDGVEQEESITEMSRRISTIPFGNIYPLYAKGTAIALLLDAAIRIQTNNAESLDKAMRYMNEEYGKKGRTFAEGEIIPIIERATGARLDEFHRRYIAGREPLPFDEYLPRIGLKRTSVVYQESMNLGGVRLVESASGWAVKKIDSGSTADSLGLQEGDILMELDIAEHTVAKEDASGWITVPMPAGRRRLDRLSFDAMSLLVEHLPRGSRTLRVLRNGIEVDLSLALPTAQVVRTLLALDGDAPDSAVVIRTGMFGF